MALYELRTYTLRVGTMVEGGEMSVWSTKTRTAALSVRARWRPGIMQGKRTPQRYAFRARERLGQRCCIRNVGNSYLAAARMPCNAPGFVAHNGADLAAGLKQGARRGAPDFSCYPVIANFRSIS